jgi:hypothetical protein
MHPGGDRLPVMWPVRVDSGNFRALLALPFLLSLPLYCRNL